MRQTNCIIGLAEGNIKYSFQILNTTANNDKNESAYLKKLAYQESRIKQEKVRIFQLTKKRKLYTI